MSEIADAVTGTVEDLFGDATTEDAAPEAATAPEAEVAPAIELPDWEAASRDLYAEDDEDEPDFTALAAEELDQDDDLSPSEFDDDNTAALKKQLLAERKKAEHFQRQHLKTARKAWEADVRSQPWGQFLPEDLATIQAGSHRDFNRKARQVAKANYAVLKPHFEKLEAAKAQLVQQATVEARAETAAAWGSPTVGGAQVPQSAEQAAANKLDRARRSGRFGVDTVKAMIDGGQI